MADTTMQFYDELADVYHLLFQDWRASVVRQGEVLGRLIRQKWGTGPAAILDCACGIGTQAIGLASQGHQVHATDISPHAVARALAEAASFNVKLTGHVADMRHLDSVQGQFDLVIACDNALPHLLTDQDLLLAAQSVLEKLRPEGVFIASMRDYDTLLKERPQAEMPRVMNGPNARRVVFQVWDWVPDGTPRYMVHQFIVRQVAERWETMSFAAEYRALRRGELEDALREVGFGIIHWSMPEETGYYQPIIVARKA